MTCGTHDQHQVWMFSTFQSAELCDFLRACVGACMHACVYYALPMYLITFDGNYSLGSVVYLGEIL